MYDFIRLQYAMGIIDAAQVALFAARGWISAAEAEQMTDKL